MRPSIIKFSFVFLLMGGISLILFYIIGIHNEVWFRRWSNAKAVTLPYVVVHIDLKGAPPKLSYLESILPEMRDKGVNGLLMEYEDMFPYTGKIANISARNCYERSQLQDFIFQAVNLGYEIIPLVQTFGHLEHVLKLKEFRHLREWPIYPDSICPSKRESKVLIHLMLEQVILFHNNIKPLKYIHVGCDEVFQLNKCPRCMRKRISNTKLFLDHLQYVSTTVRDLSPDTTMLIWDDMIRPLNPLHWINITKEIPASSFDNIEPVYWDYTPQMSVSLAPFSNYHKTFKNVWTASAFKGADGTTAIAPHLKNRALNHYNWMELLYKFQLAGQDFKGIILTGWSRYSHMDPPCELLPVSYPSLILSILIIKRFTQDMPVIGNFNEFYKNSIVNEYKEALHCNSVQEITNSNEWICTFEGWALMSMLHRYDAIAKKAIDFIYDDGIPPLSSYEYYAKYNYINVKYALESLKWCNETILHLEDYKTRISRKMKHFYSDDVVREYVGYRCYSINKKIKAIRDNLNRYVGNANYWDRNPNNYSISD